MGNVGCFTRRDFLSAATLFGASLCCPRLAWADATRPVRLRFGVISDIHLRCEPGRNGPFQTALTYFRDHGADAVMIAGDIADSGRVAELKLCADTWFSIFPDDKAPDGRHVERLFVMGNHCVDAWIWAKSNPHYRSPITDETERLADSIGYADVRQKAWQSLFHEDFRPVWKKTVKGFSFVGSHWEKKGQGIPIEAFMKDHAKEFDPSRPFFYVQHEHPKDTVFGPWAWGHDDGRSTRALSAFPNAVAFSGHSHYSLTDERSIWQGAFTSVNASSLFNGSTEYALRENGRNNRFGYMGEKRPRRMSEVSAFPARQGQFVTVYDDCLTIDRIDFVSGQSLGDTWVVPLPLSKGKPFDFAVRRATRVAPEFARDARVVAALGKTKDGQQTVELSFPRAETRKGCRVFDYEVTAQLVADDVELVQAQRHVLSPDIFRPDLPKFHQGATCTFACDDLPLKGAYRFTVRPIECFGKKGAGIVSEPIVIS